MSSPAGGPSGLSEGRDAGSPWEEGPGSGGPRRERCETLERNEPHESNGPAPRLNPAGWETDSVEVPRLGGERRVDPVVEPGVVWMRTPRRMQSARWWKLLGKRIANVRKVASVERRYGFARRGKL